MSDAYERALRKIANYDASKPEGYLDEWQEAKAFGAVQEIALNALEPGRAQRLREAADRERGLVRARKREILRGIGANKKWFVHDYAGQGVWVRVLPKGDEREDCVVVKVLEVVGRPLMTNYTKGAEFSVNTANLIEERRATEMLAQLPTPPPPVEDPRVQVLRQAVGETVARLTREHGRLTRTAETFDMLSIEIGKTLRTSVNVIPELDHVVVRAHGVQVIL